MNPTDNTELEYICCTEAALGQATALANIPLTGNESPTNMETLLFRCRELLKCLDHTNVHRWEQDELFASSDLASETSRANELLNSLCTMTRLTDRHASLENRQAQPAFKPKETKDPEPFTGSRTDLKRFRIQLALVLADVGRFTDTQHQLRYSFSLLKGNAYTIMEPYVSPSGVTFPDIEAFLNQITRIFGDSDKTTTISREPEKFIQGSRDFARYCADFARLTAILNLTEERKMQSLVCGISSEIRNAMAYQDTPDNKSLESNVGRLKRMNECLRRIRGQPKGPPITPQNPRSQVTTTTTTGTHPGPMDLSAAKRTVSPEEPGRRIAEGLCFYCAGTGHQARSCPNRPRQRPIRTIPTTPGLITSATINDKEAARVTNQGNGEP